MATKKPEYLKFNSEAGYCDITLSRGLDLSGAKVTAVRMREPTVADQEVASASGESDATREISMFANLCEITPDDIRKMPVKDYRRLQEAYVNFIS